MDGKQIKEITPEGISYLDDEGNQQFIDFAECYANYVRTRTSPEYKERFTQRNSMTDDDWDNHLKRVARFKGIGVRDIMGSPPYIEFYSNPLTQFSFATQKEFSRVETAINQARWRTIDLS